MSPEINLTISPDRFSIDGVPTTTKTRNFDGKDAPLPEITFEHPETRALTSEQSANVENFVFNGTALLTPKAVDGACQGLNIDTLERSRLSGKLLILNLESGIQYGMVEIRSLLEAQGISLEAHSVPEYIVLFRTRLMKQVLETTDETGTPAYSKLSEIQKNRPGITPEGAKYLQQLGLANAFMVDNISFEVPGQQGFHATQLLANPKPGEGEFTPLVYHVGNTENDEFTSENQGKRVRIELGNPPKKELPGYPVGVFIE
jgi:hypothetical protein